MMMELQRRRGAIGVRDWLPHTLLYATNGLRKLTILPEDPIGRKPITSRPPAAPHRQFRDGTRVPVNSPRNGARHSMA